MKRNAGNRMRIEQQRRASRKLMIAFVAVLFVGAVLQIAMIARVYGQNKQLRAVEREIRDLSANADNLNLTLNQYGNLERVTARAEQLGMHKPEGDQLRVVNLPDAIENTSVQSAGNTSAEEINQ